jgi:hypothetical protein
MPARAKRRDATVGVMPRRQLLVIAIASAAACKGGASDWVPDDIDEEATLDTVGAAGLGRVCSAFSDFVHDQYRSSYLVQAVCTAHGIRTTTDAIACADAIDECLDTLPPSVEAELDSILNQASCPTVGVTAEGCSSTVSELTSCLDELGSGLDTLQFTLTCAAAGQPVPSNWWQLVVPSSCQALQTSC